MTYYIVPIVKRELLSLWHELHDSKEPSEEAKQANKTASLGQAINVQARNKNEAASLAETQNPGCVAIRGAIERLG